MTHTVEPQQLEAIYVALEYNIDLAKVTDPDRIQPPTRRVIDTAQVVLDRIELSSGVEEPEVGFTDDELAAMLACCRGLKLQLMLVETMLSEIRDTA